MFKLGLQLASIFSPVESSGITNSFDKKRFPCPFHFLKNTKKIYGYDSMGYIYENLTWLGYFIFWTKNLLYGNIHQFQRHNHMDVNLNDTNTFYSQGICFVALHLYFIRHEQYLLSWAKKTWAWAWPSKENCHWNVFLMYSTQ